VSRGAVRHMSVCRSGYCRPERLMRNAARHVQEDPIMITEFDCYASQGPSAQPFATAETFAEALQACTARLAARGGFAYVVAKHFDGRCEIVFARGVAAP